MAHYYQTEAAETFFEVCGELGMCDVFVAQYPEQETGYVDERVICAECRPGTRRASMRVHSQEPDRVATIACFCPNGTDKAIEFANQQTGEHAMTAAAAEVPLKPQPQTKPQCAAVKPAGPVSIRCSIDRRRRMQGDSVVESGHFARPRGRLIGFVRDCLAGIHENRRFLSLRELYRSDLRQLWDFVLAISEQFS